VTAARRSKVVPLAQAVATIPTGARVAFGGNVNNNVALAGVRELIRQGRSGCTLIAFGQGLGADLLIGAGVVDVVHTNYIGMEHLGLAPCFRRAAGDGSIRVVDWDSLGMIMALQAAASGVPLAAVPAGIETTTWPTRSPDIYRRVVDPFSGAETFVVPPLRIDVAVLYASAADPFGNARHRGFVFWDELLAQAADRVIIVCEEVLPNEEIRAAAGQTTIPGYLVEHVVASPGAAAPGGAPPEYAADNAHLERYCAQARTADGFTAYLEQFVSEADRRDQASGR
jgi:glutaconate CoA-transferase, subunit A